MLRVRMIFIFAAMVGFTVLALKLLNWLPLSIEKEGIRSYKSLEDVKTELRIKKIYLPSYFPQRLEWPPYEIYAQRKPISAVLMHFRERGKNDTVLAVREADSRGKNLPETRIEPTKIKTHEKVIIKGRPARLSLGLCSDGDVCNKIQWQAEEGYDFTIILKGPTDELIRIAGSMVSE